MRIPRQSLGDFTTAFFPPNGDTCGFWTNLFQGASCISASQPGAVLPAPALAASGAPGVTLSSAPIAGQDSVYAGVDSNGNPVYINTLTASQMQALNVQQVASSTSSALAAAQADADAANQPPPPDCTTFFNSYFNSQCPDSLPNMNIGALVLIGVLGFGGFVILLNKLAKA